ncbi:hypothetical protein COOONC_10081 [Cooperia oncophora]
MLECPRSPSTSLASSGRETGSSGREHGVASGSAEHLNASSENPSGKHGVSGLAMKRLVRVPCGKTTTALSDSAQQR